jgi:hypothetical protein
MRKGYRLIAGFLFFFSCFLPGCATDKVARDLADYVNLGVLGIAELEQKSLTQYASVTGGNYTTDDRVLETLRDHVIPLYKRFLDGLRNLRPQTEEVKQLHKIYIFSAESLYEGFREKLVGIETKDENIIRSANAKIEKGRAENERWRKELGTLAEKKGLKEETKE